MNPVMTSAVPEDDVLQVIEGVDTSGGVMNVDDPTIVRNVQDSIRRGHPQVWPTGLKQERVVLVGSGPSLRDTEAELIELVRGGAKLITMNGAYLWCLERNLVPHAQIVLDARPSNARFVNPALPNCRYYLASQCAPEVFDAVQGRPWVGIWHAQNYENKNGVVSEIQTALNEYYMGQWTGISGGTTVFTRGLVLLRTMGYVRFEVFGVDSCWMHDRHHALDQPENETDKQVGITCFPTGFPELTRSFVCAPWMVKQLEDFLQVVRVIGHTLQLNVHGDGLIACILASFAKANEISLTKE